MLNNRFKSQILAIWRNRNASPPRPVSLEAGDRALGLIREAYFHDQTKLADKQVVSRFIAFHVARVRPQGNYGHLGSAFDPNLGRSTCRAFPCHQEGSVRAAPAQEVPRGQGRVRQTVECLARVRTWSRGQCLRRSEPCSERDSLQAETSEQYERTGATLFQLHGVPPIAGAKSPRGGNERLQYHRHGSTSCGFKARYFAPGER